jgi:hypothetical protein
MEALCSSEVLVTFHHFAWLHIPKDCSLKVHKSISDILQEEKITLKGYETGLATSTLGWLH